jgi:3-hydroxyacyl-CoA dehydrogenase, C-terminal domain
LRLCRSAWISSRPAARLFRDGDIGLFAAIIAQFRDRRQLAQILCRVAWGKLKLGANRLIGPLALADLIGLDVILNVMETLYQGFEDSKYRPSPLKQMVDAGYLGRKSGRGFYKYEQT